MPSSSPVLSADQLEELQAFLRDWLRHSGRTQSDLRRALRAASIRMPVLIDALHGIYRQGGLVALAERLCGIEALWQLEDEADPRDHHDPLGQLDLLLEEIRQDSPS
ncbi:MAG: hypothetical protein VKI83_08140 [Synechococcaceae cyanobacterium]|nr:hypothetical protein [Synechococcaceae cyanobacterium]